MASITSGNAESGSKRDPPTPAQLTAHFRGKFEDLASAGCDATGVLFFGDSDIEYWDVTAAFPGLRLQHCGVGGARMSDCASFAPTLLKQYHGLSAIVVVAGENDLGWSETTAQQCFGYFQSFLAAVRRAHPRLPVLYICTKPEPATAALQPEYQEYDQLIGSLAQKDINLEVLGDRAAFLLAAGGAGGGDYCPDHSLFREDGLHLSAEGYGIWNGWVSKALRARGIMAAAGRGAVYLFVEIDVKPGRRVAFLEKLTAHGKNVRAEPGCLWLDILTDTQSEDKVLVWEGWASRAEWDVHMENASSAAWGGVASEYVFGEKITIMDLKAKM
jgi:quinol monooxygenase YgiN/lysophospholipase L1-like esterase